MGAADARALPQRPPGRRARDVPGGAARARRRAGARAGAGAAAAPGGDPRAGPGDRGRPGGRRRRGNLPAPSTSFVGREDELAEVGGAAARAPPRDADRAAGRGQEPARRGGGARARGRVPRRDLDRRLRPRAAATADVVRLLADVVDVRGADPLARVVVAPARREAHSLVLDACEHVLERGGARRVAVLLRTARELRVLATSREVLHVAGEVRVPVAPLDRSARGLRRPWSSSSSARARPGPDSSADDEAAALAAEIARRVDGLPLGDRARRRAGQRARARGAPLDPRAPRLDCCATARRPTRAGRRCRRSSSGATTSCTATRRRCCISSPSTAAARRWRRSRPSRRSTASTRRPSPTSSVRWSTSRSCRSSFSGDAARYDMLDTVREYVLERLAESGGLAAARARARRVLRDARRRGARRAARTRLAALGAPPGAGERQPLGRARVRPRRRRTRPSRPGSARLGWYFALAERVSEGRRFLELALAAAGDDAPVDAADRAARDLCYLATEELDLDAALAAGERALALAAGAEAPRQLGLAQVTLALALAGAGDAERADALARGRVRDARGGGRRLGRRGSSLIRAIGRRARRRRRDRRRDGGDGPAARGRDRLRRVPRPGAAARGVGRGAAATTRGGGRRIPARARARDGASGSATTRRSRSPGSGRTRSRAAICARPRSSSARRSRRPRRRTRRGSRPTRASSSPASPRRPAMPTAPSGCTATCSNGRRRSGRAKRARACSSRSPATRAPKRCTAWRRVRRRAR